MLKFTNRMVDFRQLISTGHYEWKKFKDIIIWLCVFLMIGSFIVTVTYKQNNDQLKEELYVAKAIQDSLVFKNEKFNNKIF